MPVNDSVTLALDSVLGELWGGRVVESAGEVVQEAIALIEAVGHVPAGIDLGHQLFSRIRLTCIGNKTCAENDDGRHDGGEKSAALEAHFLALALLSETGDFFC